MESTKSSDGGDDDDYDGDGDNDYHDDHLLLLRLGTKSL